MEPIRAQVHAPAAYAERITTLVSLAGLRPTADVELALLVAQHDDPSATDSWLVDSLPHLVMRLSPEGIRVGPFVQPGVTACLRCVQVGSAPVLRALPGLASDDDLDPALLMAAVGCAVRDLATWQRGGLPITWSSSIMLTNHLQPEVERWPRHPHCGCSWGPADYRVADGADYRAG